VDFYISEIRKISNSISSRIALSPRSLKIFPDLYSIPHLVLSIIIFEIAVKELPKINLINAYIIICKSN